MDTAADLVHFLRERYPDIRYAKQIKPAHCEAYLESKTASCTQETVNQYAARLKKLARVVSHTFHVHVNYSCTVPTSTHTGKLRDVTMTREDLAQICNAGKDCQSKSAVLLTAETGLRAESLVLLKVKDVDFQSKTLFIYKDKGGRSRKIDVGEAGMALLQRLCENKKTGDYLFTGRNGKAHLSSDAVNKFLRDNGRKCGITRYTGAKSGVHSIRKMVARELYYQKRAEGSSHKNATTYVMRHLGHSSIRKNLQKVYLGDV